VMVLPVMVSTVSGLVRSGISLSLTTSSILSLASLEALLPGSCAVCSGRFHPFRRTTPLLAFSLSRVFLLTAQGLHPPPAEFGTPLGFFCSQSG
jgi:hypothetical protein